MTRSSLLRLRGAASRGEELRRAIFQGGNATYSAAHAAHKPHDGVALGPSLEAAECRPDHSHTSTGHRVACLPVQGHLLGPHFGMLVVPSGAVGAWGAGQRIGFHSSARSDRGMPQPAESDSEGDAAAEQRSPPTDRVVALVDQIAELTLVEVADLTALLKRKLGIPDMPMGMGGMMPMGMMPGMMPGGGAPGAGDAGAAAAEAPKVEKTSFDVKLEKFDAAAKLKVIKEVRALTGLGLKESKDLVESAPAVLKKGVGKEEAESIAEKLKAVGAEVALE